MSWKLIPSELADAIADYNHDNRSTLLASALVARQWVRASRYHTFTEVGITADNAQEFIGLLASPYCTFKVTLRSLNVELVPGSQRWFSEFSKRLLSMDTISIDALRISGSSSTVVRDEAVSALVLYSGRIVRFSVGALVFNSFASFAQILQNFTALETLYCAATFRTGPPLHPDFRCTLLLKSLELASPCIQPVLEFLGKQGLLPTIASISLVQLAQGDYAPLAQFLCTSNDSLKALSIKMDGTFSGVDVDAFVRGLDLSHLVALRQLRLDTTPKLAPGPAHDVLATAAPEARLESLHLSLALVQGVARIDVVLSCDVRFTSLRRLIVLGAAWDEVRQLLPRCDAMNILQPAV